MNAVVAESIDTAAAVKLPQAANDSLPPADAAAETAKRLATEAVELADALVVDSADMYQFAAGELQELVARRKQIEDLRMSITRPMDEAKRRVIEMFRPPVEAIERAENKIKQGMAAFQRVEAERIAKERAEAERRAREEREAAEAQRREAEALAEAARKQAEAAAAAGDNATAAAALQQAAEAAAMVEQAEATAALAEVAPIVPIEENRAKAAGVSTRQNWKAELVDLKALVIAAGKAAEAGDETLLGYLSHNQTALNGVARSLKSRASVPGVRFYNDTTIAVRTKA